MGSHIHDFMVAPIPLVLPSPEGRAPAAVALPLPRELLSEQVARQTGLTVSEAACLLAGEA